MPRLTPSHITMSELTPSHITMPGLTQIRVERKTGFTSRYYMDGFILVLYIQKTMVGNKIG